MTVIVIPTIVIDAAVGREAGLCAAAVVRLAIDPTHHTLLVLVQLGYAVAVAVVGTVCVIIADTDAIFAPVVDHLRPSQRIPTRVRVVVLDPLTEPFVTAVARGTFFIAAAGCAHDFARVRAVDIAFEALAPATDPRLTLIVFVAVHTILFFGQAFMGIEGIVGASAITHIAITFYRPRAGVVSAFVLREAPAHATAPVDGAAAQAGACCTVIIGHAALLVQVQALGLVAMANQAIAAMSGLTRVVPRTRFTIYPEAFTLPIVFAELLRVLARNVQGAILRVTAFADARKYCSESAVNITNTGLAAATRSTFAVGCAFSIIWLKRSCWFIAYACAAPIVDRAML